MSLLKNITLNPQLQQTLPSLHWSVIWVFISKNKLGTCFGGNAAGGKSLIKVQQKNLFLFIILLYFKAEGLQSRCTQNCWFEWDAPKTLAFFVYQVLTCKKAKLVRITETWTVIAILIWKVSKALKRMAVFFQVNIPHVEITLCGIGIFFLIFFCCS